MLPILYYRAVIHAVTVIRPFCNHFLTGLLIRLLYRRWLVLDAEGAYCFASFPWEFYRFIFYSYFTFVGSSLSFSYILTCSVFTSLCANSYKYFCKNNSYSPESKYSLCFSRTWWVSEPSLPYPLRHLSTGQKNSRAMSLAYRRRRFTYSYDPFAR